MQVQFKAVGGHGNTCGIGVEVSLDKFADRNELCDLVTCTELKCRLECDPAAGKGEAAEQETMLPDSGYKLECVARTHRTSIGLETASFGLQIQHKGNEESCAMLMKFADRVGTLTITRLKQVEETGAE
jgi:hypothetical protein